MKLEELKKYTDKSIAILGFGKEGKSTLNFLNKLGFKNISILDKNKILNQEKNINYIDNDNYLENLNNYSLIIKTPGITPYSEKLSKYEGKIITQSEIFIENYKGKIIGVTGTKGKSTTSTLLFKTFEKAGYKVKIVGNIGNPVLDEIDILNQEKYDYIVYEMSSYMLEGLKPRLFIGYVNNIYDCHLDWHNGRKNYEIAKLNILKYSENKIANIQIKDFVDNIDGIHYFGNNTNYLYKEKTFTINNDPVLIDENIILEGGHNRINILGIITIIDIIRQNSSDQIKVFVELLQALKEILKQFSGLPHRLENVGNYKGITFIDDAIASTPDSTIAAIKTYEQKIGTLFLGDMDSGFNFTELKNTIIKNKIPNIVIFPESGNYILGDFYNYNYGDIFEYEIGNHKFKILKTDNMHDAVKFAYKNTSDGKICLLSTGGPTFTGDKYSCFKGYIDQGNQFQKEVKNQGKK